MLSATSSSPDVPSAQPAWHPPTYSVGLRPSVGVAPGVTATVQTSPGTAPYTGGTLQPQRLTTPKGQPVPPACQAGMHYDPNYGCVIDTPLPPQSSGSSPDVPSSAGVTAKIQPQTMVAPVPGPIMVGTTPWWVWGLGGLAAIGAAGGLWYVLKHR